MAFKIKYSPRAQDDMDEVFDYLADEAGLDIALRFEAGVKNTTKELSIYPNMGVKRLYSADPTLDLQMPPVSDLTSYLLYYTPKENEIVVLRVVHGSRDMKNLKILYYSIFRAIMILTIL